MGIPQDNDQSSCKIQQTIQYLEATQETHYNWEMMHNKDGWNPSIYMTDVSNCLFFSKQKITQQNKSRETHYNCQKGYLKNYINITN